MLGGSSLEREALAVSRLLAEDRLADARQQLTHLVGRDTSNLDESEIVRAVVESVAENTSDAVVAPLLLGGLLGSPACWATGRRTRWTRWSVTAASATSDSAGPPRDSTTCSTCPGARLTALLAVLLGPDPRQAVSTWRRDAAGHPSPNAGPVEAAFAGALGIRLGGTNRYGDRTEHRHVLGSGRAPAPEDIDRAVTLARQVDRAGLVVAALVIARH